MDLRNAIARHRAARAALAAYHSASIDIDEATFEELNAEASAALEAVVDAPEMDEDGFFKKLRYITEFEASKMRYAPPQLWQINGSVLVVLWRRFGWDATRKPAYD